MIFLWQQISNLSITELLLQANPDGIVFDVEHGDWTLPSLNASIGFCRMASRLAYVRLGKHDLHLVPKVLDYGADGIILANVQSASEISELKSRAYQKKFGSHSSTRGVALVRDNGWGDYNLLRDEEPHICAQIESWQAVNNINNIVQLSDSVMLGPYDLSKSLGFAGDFERPAFKRNVELFERSVPDSKKSIHVPRDIGKNLDSLNWRNYNFVAVGMDSTQIIDSARDIFRELKAC